jgi:hypothetical protein
MARRFIGVSRFLQIGLVFTLVLAFGGCATLFTGTSDEVRFESEPSGATVVIDGIDRGTTPTTVSIDRSINDKRVTIEKEGYEEREFQLQKDFNAVSVLNLANLLFWGVDLATGSVYKYSPKQYETELDEASSSSARAPKRIAGLEHKTYTVEALQKGQDGEIVLPDGRDAQAIVVKDAQRNAVYVFE